MLSVVLFVLSSYLTQPFPPPLLILFQSLGNLLQVLVWYIGGAALLSVNPDISLEAGQTLSDQKYYPVYFLTSLSLLSLTYLPSHAPPPPFLAGLRVVAVSAILVHNLTSVLYSSSWLKYLLLLNQLYCFSLLHVFFSLTWALFPYLWFWC